MNVETKDLVEKLNRDWEAMKSVLNTAETERKTHGTVLGETKASIDAFNARMDALEAKLQRPGAGGNGNDRKGERPASHKLYLDYMRKGGDEREVAYIAACKQEQKTMTVGDDTLGGFGSPDEFVSGIIKGIIEVSPLRTIVNVRQTSMRSSKVMKRTGTFAAVWVGELDDQSAETSGLAYGLEEIPTHELAARVDVSKADLEDNAFDLEGELNKEFVEQFAYAEAIAGFSGNGVTRPEGLFTNSAAAIDADAGSAVITYDGLTSVQTNGKLPYYTDGRFIFSLKTLGYIRQMKTGDGVPLWTPLASGAPATVLGSPYTIVQAMDSVGASKKPVAFGDFKKAYTLVDRVNIEVTRDPYTQASKGAVRFWARKRLGGQVVLAEAYRILQCGA